ncbi:putative bifunctional diguanylate cyclase/phosphodiesterase [Butyrivibrio sp. VCD2006]|uniref:putative bifunctional diguanylate cyclase/phosphodiesterase n=1 Tax=Butyrivibrio sp. VCD2006 TaxID=1280664 RepID=UPI00040D6F35|nr:EAL domain-containing protein [Butyrivibrio sp. VCD2006]
MFSPITVGLVLILLVSEIGRLGQFKWSTVAMATGIFIWFVADILFLINDFFLPTPGAITEFVEDLYLFPDAFFAICISVYMISKLIDSRIEIAFLLSNSLCFAISLFVVILRFHIYAAGVESRNPHWKELIFFFVSFFIMMMCFELVMHLEPRQILRGPFCTTIGIFGYAVLDIEYDFLRSIGLDAENDITNLLYVLCMILMGVGTTFQIINKYDYKFKRRDFSKEATTKRFVFIVLMIAFDIVLVATEFLTQTLGTYIIITLLSYLITNYVLHAQFLSEELLKNQQEQNTILEERIQEKTKDLESANERLNVISITDMLTGLLNRRSATEFLEKKHKECDEEKSKFAVFCTDLNHFKPVNDTYGHEMGDRVLKEIGSRLNSLPAEYTSFRMGGDEFLVVLSGITEQTDLKNAADSLRELFNTPIILDKYIFNLSASIGIAVYPDDSDDWTQLLNYGDNAMYEVKKSGNKDDYKFFDARMVQALARKQLIRMAVEHADVSRDFFLHYQPQVETESGDIIGVEVFPRLMGELEIVSPTELIPIAEECGLLPSLGIWIVRQSFKTISEFNSKYNTELALTINLSTQQLIDAEFIEELERSREEFDIKIEKIILDISTDFMMGSTNSSRDTLEAFHNYGFRLSLNDFGGTSINLKYLMNCGINYIKLSRDLIQKIDIDDGVRILVESIVGFAKAMNITVAAVGVETGRQCQTLSEMGITKMQGYLISKPLKQDEFEKLLAKGKITW